MRFFLLSLVISLTAKVGVASSDHYRLKVDFSLKETVDSGKYHLFMGTIYYNITDNILLYDLKFPKKQKWLVTDTCTYLLLNDTVSEKKQTPGFVEQSLFHLILSGDLNNFGLSNTFLKITNVEKDQGMVISTWEPSEENEVFSGKVLTSVKNKVLYGVVFLNEEGTVLSKQFYRKYANIEGINFPTEVVYILNMNNQEYYRVMTFKNAQFDQAGNDEMYNYSID